MKTHKMFRVLLAAVLFQFIALLTSAQTNIFVAITTQKQGAIKGDATIKGSEGKIECSSFSTQIISPRDAASGLASGKRMHKPVVFTMHFSPAAVQLITAANTNENITKVEFTFLKPGPTGLMVNAGKVVLTDANIMELEEVMEKTATNPADKTLTVKVSLVYRKIETDYDTVQNTDDWSAPVN